MVLAGPGSGKTSVITARAVFFAEKKFGNVLVITYSKAAATEMQDRFEKLNGSASSLITFGTFHSVFYRMLRRKQNYSLEQIFNEGERKTLVRGFLKEMKYDLEDDLIKSIMSEMALVRNELLEINDFNSSNITPDDFRQLFAKYEEYKRTHNKIDFDDMLCTAYNVLRNDPAELDYWRRKYPYMMIDEFQDINKVQYEAMRILAQPANNLFIVGDDDQSIYRFRGSRPEFLLNFPADYPQARRVTLATNYRSTDAVIAYANSVITKNEVRYNKDIVGTGQSGPLPLIITAEDQNQEAVKIAERIRDMLRKGANPSEIAVAYRLNLQARAFMDAFLNMNIPFRSRDEMPTLYEHWIAEDIYAYLRLAKKVYNKQKMGFDPDLHRIINKPYRFISKAFIAEAKKHDKDMLKMYKTDKNLHISTKSNIEALHSALLSIGRMKTANAIKYIRREIGYNLHIIDTCDYRRLKPQGLMEIADELTEAAKLYSDSLDFIAHCKYISEIAKQKDNNEACCLLTTLHSAKGLEFEKVFIAGVVEDVLPSVYSKTKQEIEEERRLFYVGVTRAKHELYISIVKSRYDKPVKPSRFLGVKK